MDGTGQEQQLLQPAAVGPDHRKSVLLSGDSSDAFPQHVPSQSSGAIEGLLRPWKDVLARAAVVELDDDDENDVFSRHGDDGEPASNHGDNIKQHNNSAATIHRPIAVKVVRPVPQGMQQRQQQQQQPTDSDRWTTASASNAARVNNSTEEVAAASTSSVEHFYQHAFREGIPGEAVHAAAMHAHEWHRKWTLQEETGHGYRERINAVGNSNNNTVIAADLLLPLEYAEAMRRECDGAKNPSPEEDGILDDDEGADAFVILEPAGKRDRRFLEGTRGDDSPSTPHSLSPAVAAEIEDDNDGSIAMQPSKRRHRQSGQYDVDEGERKPSGGPVLVRPVPMRIARPSAVYPPDDFAVGASIPRDIREERAITSHRHLKQRKDEDFDDEEVRAISPLTVFSTDQPHPEGESTLAGQQRHHIIEEEQEEQVHLTPNQAQLQHGQKKLRRRASSLSSFGDYEVREDMDDLNVFDVGVDFARVESSSVEVVLDDADNDNDFLEMELQGPPLLLQKKRQKQQHRREPRMLDSIDRIQLPDHVVRPAPISSAFSARIGLDKARDCLLHALAGTGGETASNPEFDSSLRVLQDWYASTTATTTNCGSSRMNNGMWLTLSKPTFFGQLGENDSGDPLYTLGRMSFDMFSPTNLVCSLQGNFNSVEEVKSLDDVKYVPKSLRAEIAAKRSQLRTYNIIAAFTIETPLAAYPDAPNQDVHRPIRGLMHTYGFSLPDPDTPHRDTIWITGGRIEPNNDTQDFQAWKRQFELHPAKVSGFGQKAKFLAVKLLMGATATAAVMDESDGSFEYAFTRPLGGHGVAYIDTLFVDDSLRVVRGHRGTTFVFTRLPDRGDEKRTDG